jgi:hypothetical protein
MKRLFILLVIVFIPFFIVIVVNETNKTPSTLVNKTQCTRACHNTGCIHFNAKLKDNNESSFVTRHYSTYKKNIIWLKNNPFNLSYVQINLLLYVILFPIISIVLLWRLIKKPSRFLNS